MMVTKPLFRDVSFWLNKMCVLPYTDDELDCLGCLGFDMKHNEDFAEKYMDKLMERYNPDNDRIPFSELNVQLYREVLELPDLKNIPTWIRMPDTDKIQQNPIKARIAKLQVRLKDVSLQEQPLNNLAGHSKGDFSK